jgi:hypothetical protein
MNRHTLIVLAFLAACDDKSNTSSDSGAVEADTDTDTDTDTGVDTDALWVELLALDGMHWAYRAQNTDGDEPVSGDDPILFFGAAPYRCRSRWRR